MDGGFRGQGEGMEQIHADDAGQTLDNSRWENMTEALMLCGDLLFPSPGR